MPTQFSMGSIADDDRSQLLLPHISDIIILISQLNKHDQIISTQYKGCGRDCLGDGLLQATRCPRIFWGSFIYSIQGTVRGEQKKAFWNHWTQKSLTKISVQNVLGLFHLKS